MNTFLSDLHQPLQMLAPELSQPSARVVIGVSGGPDSMLLLWAMKELLTPSQVFVVHLNYQLRGDASEKDQRLVEEVCELWNVDYGAFRVDSTPGLAEGENFQDWARRERYRILAELAYAENAHFVLTAHHQDDQLETVLMKILRGAGMGAWYGIQPRCPLPFSGSIHSTSTSELLRPLLSVSRRQIMEVIQKEHIPYRIDMSNEESTYARNFLRNQWYPELHKFFPGWEKNLLQLSKRAIEFKALADYVLTTCVSQSEPHQLLRDPWYSLQDELKSVILADWFTQQEIPFSQGQLETAVKALGTLQTGQCHEYSSTLSLFCERDYFYIQKTPLAPQATPETKPHSLAQTHSETQTSSGDQISEETQKFPVIYVITPSLSDETAHFGLFGASLTLQKRSFLPHENPSKPSSLSSDSLYLDMEVIQTLSPEKEPSLIRKWKPGDRIQPLGMQGHQLISDLLTNHKLTTQQKQQTLVFESGSRLLAVLYPFDYQQSHTRSGVISELAKCSSKTRECLVIKVKHG